jgi:hypothetical protein
MADRMGLPSSAFSAARGPALKANVLAKIGGNRHGDSGEFFVEHRDKSRLIFHDLAHTMRAAIEAQGDISRAFCGIVTIWLENFVSSCMRRFFRFIGLTPAPLMASYDR